jgi:putative transposase
LENDFLRAENRVLRDLQGDKRPHLAERHRRLLVKYGMPIRDRLAEVISIVKPETLLTWNRRMKQKKWDYSRRKKRIGRPPKSDAVEGLIVRLAEENAWGYVRITGELRKLGHAVSPSGVRDILKKHGLPPSPNRKGLSWKTFIQSHLDVTWAADFFTEEVWTKTGLVTFYVLIFIHLKTRRIWIAGCTPNPESAWMRQQAKNLVMTVAEPPEACRYLIHDRDTSFLAFDDVLKSDPIEVVKTSIHSPWCNGYAERFVREARETLNNLILLGEGHLRHALRKIETHHNRHRPHRGLENAIPLGYDYPDGPAPPDSVRCESALGGLLNHYHADKACPARPDEAQRRREPSRRAA